MVEVKPTADELKAFGYAPGFYMIPCKDCSPEQRRDGRMADKRAWRCEEHALIAWGNREANVTPETVEVIADEREIERAQAVVRKFYPEMKPTYAGRRVQIAIEAERAGRTNTLRSLADDPAMVEQVARALCVADWGHDRLDEIVHGNHYRKRAQAVLRAIGGVE